ncbi:hypothetical protein Pst134EB_016821 [Puccinia striiformis f. sp. tritici]|nr:hypothetical protein Pst134EB_016821 [Puccinia striiformis f. sp. tritici]
MANIHPVVDAKVLAVCEALNKLPTKITPKVFFMRFLVSTYSQLPYLRGCWATKKGINSTMDLASALRDEINKTALGREAWEAFILQEAIQIASKQEPPRGNFPKGAFHSSTTVANHFFTAEEQQVHDNQLTKYHMPFIYGLLMGILKAGTPTDDSAQEEERPPVDPTETPDDSSTLPEEMDGIAYELAHNPQDRYNHRAKRIVTTICSMVGFARNRRANALQLHNSVRFFACGISERVQEYMNYLGLCSSRSTGMSALNTLAKGNIKMLKTVMAINKEIPMAASICIDNIDMEQRVHQSSVGHRSHTFRGTWGYIHLPNKKLLATLDCSQLTLDAYHEAIKQVPSMEIEPMMFLPTKAEQEVELAVWKSQIALVLHKYLATPLDKKTALPTEPPQVEQISHEAPNLHMLKLMDASDNSAEGMGQVFHNLLQQTGLTSEEFFSQLQPMDGDLGTVQNFNCLQAQRAPSAVPSNRLDNIFFQLGAACWNLIPSSNSLKRKNPSHTDLNSHTSKRSACHLMNDIIHNSNSIDCRSKPNSAPPSELLLDNQPSRTNNENRVPSQNSLPKSLSKRITKSNLIGRIALPSRDLNLAFTYDSIALTKKRIHFVTQKVHSEHSPTVSLSTIAILKQHRLPLVL